MDRNEHKTIASTVPGFAEISKSYMEDFVLEIREILEEIELELVNLEMDPGNMDYLNTIYCSFHTIRGLAGLLNDTYCGKMAAATEELLEARRKYSHVTTKSIINLILDSVNFMKKMLGSNALLNDTQFLGELDRHVASLKKSRNDLFLEVRQSMEKESRIGEILISEGAMEPSEVEAILKKQSSMQGKMKFGEIV